MSVVMYSLVCIIVVGLFATLFFFFKFLASIVSLSSAVRQAKIDHPQNGASSGLISLWGVLCYRPNAMPIKVLVKHAVLLAGAFGITMGAGLLSVKLNTQHCIFPMTMTKQGGAETVICPAER